MNEKAQAQTTFHCKWSNLMTRSIHTAPIYKFGLFMCVSVNHKLLFLSQEKLECYYTSLCHSVSGYLCLAVTLYFKQTVATMSCIAHCVLLGPKYALLLMNPIHHPVTMAKNLGFLPIGVEG